MRSHFFTVGLLFFSACATVGKPDVDTLKPTIESFHTRTRWKDFRAAAELIVPERRTGFIKARMAQEDEKDLFITEYQLEDAVVDPDGKTARVVSKLSWHKLPSATQQTAAIESVFVWRESTWLLESQDAGPFEELRPAPPAQTP